MALLCLSSSFRAGTLLRGALHIPARSRGLSTMRAVVLEEPGPPSALLPVRETHPIPFSDPDAPPLPEGTVRIKVAACAVAYRDIIDRTGGFPFMNRPTILGHEFSGVVEAAGPGVPPSHAVGTRVSSLHWAQGLGWPAPFDTKEAMGTFLGLTVDGGYAEFAATHYSAFVPMPAHWEAKHAAPLVSTFGTVWQGAMVRGALQAGERVLITGASGGVGSAAVEMCKKWGCHVVAVTSDPDRKGPHLRRLGADEVLDSRSRFDKELGTSMDMVIECVGEPTLVSGLRSLKSGGRVVLIGNVTNTTAPLPLGLCIVRSLSVIGTDSCAADEVLRMVEWMDEHDIRPHIAEELRLDDAATAHEMLEQKEVEGRLVMMINQACWDEA